LTTAKLGEIGLAQAGIEADTVQFDNLVGVAAALKSFSEFLEDSVVKGSWVGVCIRY